MRKLLREMVNATTSYISSSSVSAGEFTTKASKTTKTNLWTIDQSLIATNGSIKAHSSQMTIKMEVRRAETADHLPFSSLLVSPAPSAIFHSTTKIRFSLFVVQHMFS